MEEVIDRSIPVNNFLLTGTVPVNNSLLTGTVPVKVKVSKSFPHPLKAPHSVAPKVPEFCPEIEGNPVP